MGAPIIRLSSSACGNGSDARVTANVNYHEEDDNRQRLQRYVVDGSAHTRQYAQMYFTRLARARKRMMQETGGASAAVHQQQQFKTLLQSADQADQAADGEEVPLSTVIGTIYKDQRMKPNILNDYMKGKLLESGKCENGYHGVSVMLEKMKLIDADTDTIIIEDESARMKIVIDENRSTDSENTKDQKEAKQSPMINVKASNGLGLITTAKASLSSAAAASGLHALVTGVVVAAHGRVNPDDGCFHATSISFPRPLPQRNINKDTDSKNINNSATASIQSRVIDLQDDDPHVILVSGLEIGESNQLQVQLLIDFLTGHAGSSQDIKLCSSIVRVIVAGGTISLQESFRDAIKTENNTVTNSNNYSNSNSNNSNGGKFYVDERASLKTKLREVDIVMSELASSIPVDIMPGEGEPTNHNLPQQPFHTMLLPGLSQFMVADCPDDVGGNPNDNGNRSNAQSNSVRLSTNPHFFSEYGTSFLGTSGQNIHDVYRYSSLEESLDILTHTLLWGSLAPTAPDTLPCYPVANTDIFEIDEWPDVYFSGMMDEFGTRLITFNHDDDTITVKNDGSAIVRDGGREKRMSRTRIISVPHFGKTGTVAMINLRTLECNPITFDVAE